MSQPPPAATSADAGHGDATRAGTPRRWRRLALVLAVPVGFAAGFGSMAGALALNTSSDEPPPTAASTSATSPTTDATDTPSPSASTPPGTRIASADVTHGMCFSGDPQGETIESLLYQVPCSQPHTAETIGVHVFDDGSYPGSATVQDAAVEACGAAMQKLPVQRHVVNRNEVTVAAWPPSAASWGMGDRTSPCTMSMKDSSLLVGSFLDGSAQQF